MTTTVWLAGFALWAVATALLMHRHQCRGRHRLIVPARVRVYFGRKHR